MRDKDKFQNLSFHALNERLNVVFKRGLTV